MSFDVADCWDGAGGRDDDINDGDNNDDDDNGDNDDEIMTVTTKTTTTTIWYLLHTMKPAVSWPPPEYPLLGDSLPFAAHMCVIYSYII